MITKKEMRKAINEYVASLQNREMSPSCVFGTVGTKYVHFFSLYQGTRDWKRTIEDVYENVISDLYK